MRKNTEIDLIKILSGKEISFERKNEKLNPTSLILWRVAVLTLFFSHACTGGKSSLKKLQIFYSCVSKEMNMEALINALSGESDIFKSDLVFDPTLIRVLSYMTSYGIISKENNSRFKLTDSGKQYAELILKDKVLEEYKSKLLSLPKSKYSEKLFTKIFNEAL
jgi:hypothetical protein